MPAIKRSTKHEEYDRLNLILILKGLLASYIVTIPAFMVFALILANVDFPQRLVTPVVVIITVVSVLTAGAVSTRGVRSKGWLNGSIVGLTYMIILYLFSSVVYGNFAVDRNVLTMTVIGVLSGAIGGIMSINSPKVQKYKYIDS
ncbi:MAG: TIGR04086 family membrane protein [Bacillota bacterium]|nr:TIGR04086 family membrane protein [Bacillota bacterium]HOA55229.1 TIGR04086 family membrane protein [Clostridiales bacterium]HPZ05857.1 TIGR04086 family membrane protein [Clostridiales bacterium]HQD30703.1 TIGR04086 family membrane protein [Clostridiales bacterium]